MNPEDILLWVALLALCATFLLRIRFLARGGAEGPVLRVLGAAALLLGATTALMLVYFASGRVDVDYVFSESSRQTSLPYRLAGLWGGQKGTILIWATASTVFLWINGRGWRRQRGAAPDADGFARALAVMETVGAAIAAAFVALLIISGLFDRTDPYLLSIRPDGTGLQPVLRTPFMLIHPPLQFIGYSFSTVLFAAAIAGVATRQRVWADFALPWARWAFVVATTGLGLGGLWAYYVLNFGGYWAWDPVETANLLAWFPLLLSLHALIYYRKRGMFAASAPLFALLSLLLDLFATIATRTGLWVSVHAFTDPSRNFTTDPLERLLNILDTSALLQGLCAMFLAAAFTVLCVYVLRSRADMPGEHRARRAVATLGFGAAAVLGVLALLDVRFVLSLVFQVADLIAFGRATVGLGILVFAFALVLASPNLGTSSPDREKKTWVEYVDTPRLVFLGVIFLSLAFLVVFLLLVLSVNGYERGIYDQRAPLVALPILVVLPSGLSHPFLGRRNVVAISVGAIVSGILLAVVFPAHWQVYLLLPAFSWAIVGTSIKLYKVSDPGPTGDARLRAAGALLLIGGLITIAYWANPPSRIPLGVTTLRPSVALAPVGILVGLAACLASIGTTGGQTVRAHRVGALLLVLALGFGVGALLGIVAFLLGESRRLRFPDAGHAKPIAECARGLRREIRKTGVYLVHVAIVLGLLGYLLSTYAQRPETDAMLRPGQPETVNGYELRLVGSSAGPMDRDQQSLTEVSAIVEVWRDGTLLDTVPLTMWSDAYHHYAERVRVERFGIEDVYIRPAAFVTPERSFVAHEDNVVLTSGKVDAVALTLKTLPAMHFLWGSLWTIVGAMLVNLAAIGRPWEFARAKSAPSD